MVKALSKLVNTLPWDFKNQNSFNADHDSIQVQKFKRQIMVWTSLAYLEKKSLITYT